MDIMTIISNAAGELIAAGIGGLLLWRLIPKKLFAA